MNWCDTSFVRELIRYGCDEAGHPELADRIKIEWNNRFTRRLGDARYWRDKDRGRIRLSVKLWPTMNEEDQTDLVLHETAHVIDIYLNGYNMEQGGHGYQWRKIAKQIGARRERYASASTANFAKYRRRTTRYSIPCGCDRPVAITKHRLTKMKKGYMYSCRRCGHMLDYRNARITVQ